MDTTGLNPIPALAEGENRQAAKRIIEAGSGRRPWEDDGWHRAGDAVVFVRNRKAVGVVWEMTPSRLPYRWRCYSFPSGITAPFETETDARAYAEGIDPYVRS